MMLLPQLLCSSFCHEPSMCSYATYSSCKVCKLQHASAGFASLLGLAIAAPHMMMVSALALEGDRESRSTE